MKEKKIKLMCPQSAFVTYRNPFAAFLSKKMMKIIKRNKIEDKPKMFERDINFGKMGFPSDTQYLNFGINQAERIMNYFIVAMIVYFWAYIFFYTMFTLYQMLQNRNLFILSNDKCLTVWNEYKGREFSFLDNALNEYTTIKTGGKKYGFNWRLIADDVPLMESLRGEFTCYCDYIEEKKQLDFVEVERMFDEKHQIRDKCKEYSNFKWRIKYIKLIVTLFMSVSNALSKKVIMWIIRMLNFKKRSTEAMANFVYLLTVTAFTSIVVILLLGAKLDFVPFFG